jgi:hypothetical protein
MEKNEIDLSIENEIYVILQNRWLFIHSHKSIVLKFHLILNGEWKVKRSDERILYS